MDDCNAKVIDDAVTGIVALYDDGFQVRDLWETVRLAMTAVKDLHVTGEEKEDCAVAVVDRVLGLVSVGVWGRIVLWVVRPHVRPLMHWLFKKFGVGRVEE